VCEELGYVLGVLAISIPESGLLQPFLDHGALEPMTMYLAQRNLIQLRIDESGPECIQIQDMCPPLELLSTLQIDLAI
jgi:hypothetical protein